MVAVKRAQVSFIPHLSSFLIRQHLYHDRYSRWPKGLLRGLISSGVAC
jgi:hypothetical protein